jgi:hypothetical protein
MFIEDSKSQSSFSTVCDFFLFLLQNILLRMVIGVYELLQSIGYECVIQVTV